MNWKGLLIFIATYKPFKKFVKQCKHPKIAQQQLWNKELVPLLKKSLYWSGKFSTDWNLNHFEITQYQDYEDALLEAEMGTLQPLNGEHIMFWAETSGTTGARKFFPISLSYQKQFQRTMAPYFHSIMRRFPRGFKNKILYLAAPDTGVRTKSGIAKGWISYFNYCNLASMIKNCYVLPQAILSDIQLFKQWAPLYALAHDLSAVFAVTPMVIDSFMTECVEQFDFYANYLLGKIPIPDFLPPVYITKKRKKYLQKLSVQQNLSHSDLWPSLLIGGCWTSGLCEFPARQLQKKLGHGVSLIDGTYSASEGWLTVPIDNQLGGYLHPGAHLVEFIEEGKAIDKSNLLSPWELVQGKKYEVFLSTAMGFVRYQLHDVVQCTGFFHHSPRLVFCYKAQALKLEYCSIISAELENMLKAVDLSMKPEWYFARNVSGNKIILVVNEHTSIDEQKIIEMHQYLISTSQIYAQGVKEHEIMPLAIHQIPSNILLKKSHAQTKPRLISSMVIEAT